MRPSREAQEILKENKIPFDPKELAMLLAVALVTVACWALDKYYEERVIEQEHVEQRQHQISQPKFTEM